jgi:hypothetical protein
MQPMSAFTASDFTTTTLWTLSIAAEVILLLVLIVGYWLTGRSREDKWSHLLPPTD